MTDQTQTVTETPATVTTAAPQESPQVTQPQTGAQDDDLDTLLKEYDAQAKAPTESQEPPKEPDKRVEFMAKQLQDLTAERTKERIDKALSKATDEVRKLDGLKDADPEVIQDLIYAKANKDGRFAHALLNGDSKAFRAFARSIESKFAMPDRKLSGDRLAAEAAVRGASLQPPPTQMPDVTKMTDREFFAFEKTLPK